jgi:hypothetical protein
MKVAFIPESKRNTQYAIRSAFVVSFLYSVVLVISRTFREISNDERR